VQFEAPATLLRLARLDLQIPLTQADAELCRVHYELAQCLGISVRSLQRQLQQEGQSWTTVVDAARREALITLLQQDLPLEQVAQRLGYHDASSLSRAARRRLSKTPGQWRADRPYRCRLSRLKPSVPQ
jgi:AraC-like DNA-binding protein